MGFVQLSGGTQFALLPWPHTPTSLAPTPSTTATSMMQVTIKTNRLITNLQIVTWLVIYVPSVIRYIWRHWTVAGSLYAESESLGELPCRIDRIISHHKIARPPLSQESQAKATRLKWRWAESRLMINSQEAKFRGSWFLLWRSKEAREELADLYERLGDLKADIRSVEIEILGNVRLEFRRDESEDE